LGLGKNRKYHARRQNYQASYTATERRVFESAH